MEQKRYTRIDLFARRGGLSESFLIKSQIVTHVFQIMHNIITI